MLSTRGICIAEMSLFVSLLARNYCGVVLLIHLLSNETTKALAWIQSAKIRHKSGMRSNGALFRESGGPNAFRRPRGTTSEIMAPNRPTLSGLFLSSSPQQSTISISNDEIDNGGNVLSDESHTIIDATLVEDYLVQMSSSIDGDETFAWRLYPIKSVLAANLDGSKDEERIWTDGTEATEALNSGLSSVSAEKLSGLKPRAEVLCHPIPNNDGHDDDSSLYSKTRLDNDANPDEFQDLLRLLQILQAQWVAGLQSTRVQQPADKAIESTGHSDNDDQNNGWRISVGSLQSEAGISHLFQEAGLLDEDAGHIEWVEMMSGSFRILGRLPRSFVHKFNILHRGIGAFITKDRPIEMSSLSSSSFTTSSMPDLYVHRRAADKRIFPSLYDMFVGGVSLAGEESELTAQREIAEELGLSNALSTSLVGLSGGAPILRCLVCTAYNRCLVDLFQYTMDTSDETIRWQEEEVAWGDFVDYGVIAASADLSMQRAASEGTWPGSYPPIQSELRGVLPEAYEDDTSGTVEYDGNWKEWDYVPDGLLVWKAWLEMTKSQNQNQSQQQQGEQQTLSFEVEFSVGEGKNEVVTVELASMKDVVPMSQKLATRFGANINDIQSMLKNVWADATSVPIYKGPSLLIESADHSVECMIELPSGLVLELRPSTIGKDAGLGLFVRKASSDIADVLQTQGSAFCGYGPCDQITDSLAGLSKYQRERSFDFVLSDGLESYVWHEGNLVTVGDVLQSSGATAVKSHLLVEASEKDEVMDGTPPSSKLSGLSLVQDPNGQPCYLIPPADPPDPKSLTIQTIGHMCNDLAGGARGQTEEEYSTSSDLDNLLVLVPRVAVGDDGVLQPNGMPILTLAKSVYVGNVEGSMEVGLRYGDSYWRNESL